MCLKKYIPRRYIIELGFQVFLFLLNSHMIVYDTVCILKIQSNKMIH